MKPKLFCLCLFCAVAMLAGCKTRFVDFTVISTKNVDLSKVGSFERGTARVEGSDKVSIIIFIPTGTPNLKEAIDRAIEGVPGAVALLDGVVYQSFFYVPYIYGEGSFVVEGTPLIDPALKRHAQTESAKSPWIIARVNSAGQLAALEYVSESEFDTFKQLVRSGKAAATN